MLSIVSNSYQSKNSNNATVVVTVCTSGDEFS